MKSKQRFVLYKEEICPDREGLISIVCTGETYEELEELMPFMCEGYYSIEKEWVVSYD